MISSTASATTISSPDAPSSTLPTFDVAQIPFSVRGAWINLSPVIGLHKTARRIHLVSHVTGLQPVLSLNPSRDGSIVSAGISAAPGLLTWSNGDQRAEATFDGTHTVRLRGDGLGMVLADASPKLTPFSGSYLLEDPQSGAAVFTSYETGRRYRLTAVLGELRVVGGESLGVAERAVSIGEDGQPWELGIEELTSEPEPYRPDHSFDEVVATVQSRFETYRDTVVGPGNDQAPAASLAAYVLWSATVEPVGFVRREAILMSMHWMDKVWSWDHCFNAIALASGDPDLAWDQFLAPFDHQDERGALPDSVTHSEVLFNFVKPPIHGWALTEIRRRHPTDLSLDQLRQAYGHLTRWSEFWLNSRRVTGHLLPYYQHGNDSGWDNSTTFDADRLIESPDLAAFLIVQLGVLAALAVELETGDERRWRTEASSMIEALMRELWTGQDFVARNPRTGRTSSSSSLLNLLPLLLGDQLPTRVRDRLVKRVRGHLTEWGPATEPTTSPHYESDGYWRGPIWAPSTVLIEAGLRRSGYPDLADTVNDRFRALCEQSGFAENFDAVTGAGLRDRAYTWTASSYLLLAQETHSGHKSPSALSTQQRVGSRLRP